MTKVNIKRLLFYGILFSVLLYACTKKTETGTGTFSVGSIVTSMKPSFLVPGDTTSNVHALGTFDLKTDSNLYYDVYFDMAVSKQTPNGIAIYSGDPVNNGTQLLSIPNITFNNNEATGKISLNKSQRDSITSKTLLYVVVTSSNNPNGIVRGQQINGFQVQFGEDISLAPSAANASLNTKGTALLRLLSDGVSLYSKISINNLPQGDSLTAAEVCNSLDSSVISSLYTNGLGFGTTLIQTVSSSAANNFQIPGLYFIRIKTKQYPKGLLWGKF
jgi:hypothetical protein